MNCSAKRKIGLLHLYNVYLLLVYLSISTACTTYSISDVEGLWQLEVVELDAVQRPLKPTFLEIKANRSFAVSRLSGDLAGVYRIKTNKISLYSQDNTWFNSTWSLYRFNDILELKGKDEKQRNLKLRFKKIKEIPDFQEFENKLLGSWELYKIRREGEIERLSDTWFRIDNDGNYSISSGENMMETGQAIINVRHRKLFFEHDKTEWSTWFYGDELRLTNERSDVEYSLRRNR